MRTSYRRVLRCLRRGYCLVQWTEVWAMLDWWEHSPPGLPCPDRTEVSGPCFHYLRDHGLIAPARTNDEGDVWWAITDAGLAAAGADDAAAVRAGARAAVRLAVGMAFGGGG